MRSRMSSASVGRPNIRRGSGGCVAVLNGKGSGLDANVGCGGKCGSYLLSRFGKTVMTP